MCIESHLQCRTDDALKGGLLVKRLVLVTGVTRRQQDKLQEKLPDLQTYRSQPSIGHVRNKTEGASQLLL